ncbi:MAG: right-handed parallel beta-helix repeat-containing protein [Bacteroidales bacterium]|nr:right-handed parallel beta-helix repeat-containing protein [Bacteroidales bacterium]
MRHLLHTCLAALTILSGTSEVASTQPWYVSTTGSDSNTGTLASPYKSIEKAVSVVKAGETIYVRGGRYNLTATITLGKSGTENARILLLAYPDERPVLDFTTQAFGNRGVVLTGSWWLIKGFDITGAGDNGMDISGGSNNTIDLCNFYRNRDSGLQLDNGASDNCILYCDSYCNADPTDYGDADGFAPKLTVGTGNRFYGCRAWLNCDDGWDGYLRGANDVTTTLDNCWSFRNGYLEDGTDPGANANGNGFKMGGSDDKTLAHNFILKNCLAFGNKAKGFDQNSNRGSMTLYNCTGHGNLVANYRIKTELDAGKTLTVKNCAEFGGTVELAAFAVQEKNSWLPPFMVTVTDFRSTDTTGVTGPRKSDGSLPHIEYMHLASGSDLIDAGVSLGIPFAGTAPDLGCFETGLTNVNRVGSPDGLIFYPNPVKVAGYIRFVAEEAGHCVVRFHDVTGKVVKTAAERQIEPGENILTVDLSDMRDGIYFCRVLINSRPVNTVRVLKTGSSN